MPIEFTRFEQNPTVSFYNHAKEPIKMKTEALENARQ
jgi:hypothetical protein